MCHQMKLDHKCPDGPDGDLFNCNDPDNTCKLLTFFMYLF